MLISDGSSDVCSSDLLGQAVAVENIVAKDQATRAAGKELATDHECLRQAVRARLHRVFDAHAPLRTIAEQTLEQCLLMRGVDDQHLADTGQDRKSTRLNSSH